MDFNKLDIALNQIIHMILGLGIDITEQTRIAESLQEFGQNFLRRILTEQEIKACDRYRFPVEHYAGKFAVKEAFMKAVGTGLGQVSFQEIEIFNLDSGAPYTVLHGEARKIATERGVTKIHISLSHAGQLAVAVVVLE